MVLMKNKQVKEWYRCSASRFSNLTNEDLENKEPNYFDLT